MSGSENNVAPVTGGWGFLTADTKHVALPDAVVGGVVGGVLFGEVPVLL